MVVNVQLELRDRLRRDEALFQFLHALPNDGVIAWIGTAPSTPTQCWLSPSLGVTLGDAAAAPPPTLPWLEAHLAPTEVVRLRLALARPDGHLGEGPAGDVLTCIRADGSTVRLRWRAIARPGDDDQALRVAVMTRVRPSRELDLRSVADELPIMAWTSDALGRVDYINPWAVAFTGIPSAASLADLGTAVLHPDDVAAVVTAWQVARSTGHEVRIDARIRRADGAFVRFEHRARRVEDAERGDRWFGTSVDVDEARRAHEEAHARTAELAALLEATPHAIFTIDQAASGKRQIPIASPALEALFGISATDLARDASIVRERVHPDDLPRLDAEARAALLAGRPWIMRYRYRHPVTGERVIDGHALPERHGGGVRWHLVAYDVTDHGAIERLARLAPARRGASASPAAAEVFYIFDLRAGRLRFVGDAYERLWGLPRDAAYADASGWLGAIHADDRARVAARFADATPHGHVECAYRVVRPDGSVRWIHDRAFIATDPAGLADRAIGIAVDVTAEHVATEQLRHAERMEALGHLVSGIAHDFNNLLWVIQGNSTLLLGGDVGPWPAFARDGLEDIRAAAERATTLVRQLLVFARGDAVRPRDLELNGALDETSQLLRRVLGSALRVEVNLHPHPLTVHIDRNVFDQVLMNLAVNARDAMPGGGELRLRTTVVTRAGDDGGPVGRRAGTFACLEVSDTGLGMTAAIRARIFEPFFTTKASGHGGGLGLATVANIVQQHQGWVEVDSDVGVGTTMRVCLPLVTATLIDPSAPVVSRTMTPPPPVGHGELVIVCDPDLATREQAAQLLRGLGYQVIEVADPAVATAQAAMPGINVAALVAPADVGRALGDALESSGTALAQVLVVDGEVPAARAGVAYLQRPAAGTALAAAVAEALRGRR